MLYTSNDGLGSMGSLRGAKQRNNLLNLLNMEPGDCFAFDPQGQKNT